MSPTPWSTDDLAAWRDALLRAGRFLTRLPLPAPAAEGAAAEEAGETVAETAPGRLAEAAWAFPVIGVGIGLLGGLVYALADALALPAAAAALLAVLATAALTGGLHEDGLADTADGFGGGRDAATKLAIMRDSRSGVFGVLALIFSVGLRAVALTALAEPGAVVAALVAAHAGARATLPTALRRLPPARADGLGAAAGQPSPGRAGAALAIGGLVAFLALGLHTGFWALLWTAAAAAAVAALARRQIGGYTGDVLGAIEQVGEIVMLLAAATRITP